MKILDTRRSPAAAAEGGNADWGFGFGRGTKFFGLTE